MPRGKLLGFLPGVYDRKNKLKIITEKLLRPNNYYFDQDSPLIYENQGWSQSTIKKAIKQKSIRPESVHWVNGELINFMAVGNRIRHAQREQNVMLVDIKIEQELFPQSYFKYTPCQNLSPKQDKFVLGFLAIKEI